MLRLVSRGPVQRTFIRFSKQSIIPLRQKTIIRSDWTQSLVESSYYAGKSIILFVWFYSGLQWLHYRNERKKNEEDD